MTPQTLPPASIRISVVMPAYNEEPTLRRSVQAVLDRVKDLGELIVVNDGSKEIGRAHV